MGLLLRAGLRHARARVGQSLLAVVGVALGVAVVVAVDLANDSARRAFALSAETVTGRATHQVVGGSQGLPEAFYTELRVALGLRRSAPVVEGTVVAGERPFTLLGVDPFAEPMMRDLLGEVRAPGGFEVTDLLTTPGAVLLSPQAADALGVAPGEALAVTVAGRAREVTVAGLLVPGPDGPRQALAELMVADIASAQEVLGRVGRLARIDLILEGEPPPGLEAALPPGARVVGAPGRSARLLELSSAFHFNLVMLSLLALLVGGFLIYNTMRFTVVQRREQMGVLRALGVTRGELFRAVLGEAAVVGALGSAVGIALGIALAGGLLELVTRTLNDLYFSVTVTRLHLGPGVLAKALALGLGVSLAAATFPALEAAAVAPRQAQDRSDLERRARRRLPRVSALGAAVLAASVAVMALPGGGLGGAFAGLFGVVLGGALLAPGAAVALLRLALAILPRGAGLVLPMALRGVVAGLSRTAVAVAALAVAVAATVGVGIMVESFRLSVVEWLEHRLQADVYVSVPGLRGNRSGGALAPEVAAGAADLPGVRGVSRGRRVSVESPRGPLDLFVLEPAGAPLEGIELLARAGADPGGAWAAGEAVLVSEPFARRHGLAPGAELRLATPAGERAFPVAGVYRDYGSEEGVVLMHRARYRALWGDPAVDALGLYLEAGVEAAAVAEAVRALARGRQVVRVRANRELRAASLAVFDRTFTITRVLRLLAGVVAFFGVLSALAALALERRRELAVLRAVGLTRGQLWGLVVGESAVLGALAGFLAAPLGWAMAYVLTTVVNQRAFGWSLAFHLDPALLAQGLAMAVAAALLAGLYPAWTMARAAPAAGLRGD